MIRRIRSLNITSLRKMMTRISERMENLEVQRSGFHGRRQFSPGFLFGFLLLSDCTVELEEIRG